jgi:hypothetical protein
MLAAAVVEAVVHAEQAALVAAALVELITVTMGQLTLVAVAAVAQAEFRLKQSVVAMAARV